MWRLPVSPRWRPLGYAGNPGRTVPAQACRHTSLFASAATPKPQGRARRHGSFASPRADLTGESALPAVLARFQGHPTRRDRRPPQWNRQSPSSRVAGRHRQPLSYQVHRVTPACSSLHRSSASSVRGAADSSRGQPGELSPTTGLPATSAPNC